jgi:hypothetical protein
MVSGKPVSLGSGFVVSSGGLVATNRMWSTAQLTSL